MSVRFIGSLDSYDGSGKSAKLSLDGSSDRFSFDDSGLTLENVVKRAECGIEVVE